MKYLNVFRILIDQVTTNAVRYFDAPETRIATSTQEYLVTIESLSKAGEQITLTLENSKSQDAPNVFRNSDPNKKSYLKVVPDKEGGPDSVPIGTTDTADLIMIGTTDTADLDPVRHYNYEEIEMRINGKVLEFKDIKSRSSYSLDLSKPLYLSREKGTLIIYWFDSTKNREAFPFENLLPPSHTV